MKREFLAELGLEGEAIDKIMAEHGRTVNDTKAKLSDAESDRDNYKNQLQEQSEKLDELSKTAGNSEQLKAQFDALKQAAQEAEQKHAAEKKQMQFDYALDKALIDARTRNPLIVKPLLNNENMTLGEDGNIIGLNEQLENLKSDYWYLFEDGQGDQQQNGGTATPPSYIPGQQQKTNHPQNVDPKELGKLKAQERFGNKEETAQ